MKFVFIDDTGTLRSGWRATIFLLAFLIVTPLFAFFARAALVGSDTIVSPVSSKLLIIDAVLALIPTILIGWLCGKYLEKLPFRALGAAFTKMWLVHWIWGLVIGAITLGLAVGIGFAFGGLRFALSGADSTEVLRSLAISFVVFGGAAAFEEALFRGYIMQTFARSGLAWVAILLTSVFFGAVHLGNPNVNLISTANTILAGVWFSVAYLKTRDLWFVWGMHLTWNWIQGSIFGIEVSGLTGIAATPLLSEIDSGPSWLTGQTYGVEGGVVCTIALVLSILAIHFMPNLKPDQELLSMTSKP